MHYSLLFPLFISFLLLQDNFLNQNIIKKMLERVGCEVVLAIHGKEALDILYSEHHESMPILNDFFVSYFFYYY